MIERIVLAYSGDLDGSVAISWLRETYRVEVVAMTVDLGRGTALDDVRDRAMAAGAVRAHVLDRRDEFARDFVLPALQAGALYDGGAPLATALGRSLIAKQLVEISRIEDASAIAHTCTTPRDGARMETSVRALDPAIAMIAPARTWAMTWRDKVEYATARGLPVPSTVQTGASHDLNLWGRSISGGDDPWQETCEDAYVLTKSPAETPDRPASVEIEFDRGVPVKISGVEMPLVELIQSLGTIAGAHGVGRIERFAHQSREIYEAPAAVPLHAAHRELQRFVTPMDLHRLTSQLGATYADLIDDGRWFTPAREAIDALVANVQERVTGAVRLTFHNGDCRVVGRHRAEGEMEPWGDEAASRFSAFPVRRTARAL